MREAGNQDPAVWLTIDVKTFLRFFYILVTFFFTFLMFFFYFQNFFFIFKPLAKFRAASRLTRSIFKITATK